MKIRDPFPLAPTLFGLAFLLLALSGCDAGPSSAPGDGTATDVSTPAAPVDE